MDIYLYEYIIRGIILKRIVVAGSRNYENYDEAKEYIRSCLSQQDDGDVLIFVSGGCKGADMLGERYAKEFGYPIERYPAQWEQFGKAAGVKRNKKMAEISDFVICFWDGESRGTKSLIVCAEKLGKPVHIKYI